MDAIPVARPAATVLTLREAPGGYEILMLQRNLRSEFVTGGAYVFPGGAVDDADRDTAALFYGLDDGVASARLGVDSGGLAYYAAGLRELFEEAGLLLACGHSGEQLDLVGSGVIERLSPSREVSAPADVFYEGLVREGLRLDGRGLAYVAHWVTPVGPPRRYDTRFFVTLGPTGQVAANDHHETIGELWIRPRDAVARHRAGELAMMPPTVRTLESIAGDATAADVISRAFDLGRIPKMEPRLVERDGRRVILVPGDPGYDD